MGDARLRGLERRWRESGSDADEAAYLRERARAGVLASQKLELARYCGYEALGGAEDPPRSLGDWIAHMPFRGRRGALLRDWARVPLAAGRALEPVVLGLGAGRVVPAALDAAEIYLVRPGGRPFPEAEAEALRVFMHERLPDTWEPAPPAFAMAWFAEVALRSLGGQAAQCSGEFEAWARRALYPEGWWSHEPGLEEAVESAFPRAPGRLWLLRLAIRDEIAPWALGYRDPVRERVEAAGIED